MTLIVVVKRAWDVMMKRLGYKRYVSQGGDWGSVISDAMARQAPGGPLGRRCQRRAAPRRQRLRQEIHRQVRTSHFNGRIGHNPNVSPFPIERIHLSH